MRGRDLVGYTVDCEGSQAASDDQSFPFGWFLEQRNKQRDGACLGHLRRAWQQQSGSAPLCRQGEGRGRGENGIEARRSAGDRDGRSGAMGEGEEGGER